MRRAWGVLLVGLVACGASSKRVNGPDGQGTWYSITCKRNRANCIEEAGEVCPTGYDIANGSEHRGLAVNVNPQWGSAYTTYDGQMLVKCRSPEQAPSVPVTDQRF